MRWRRFVFPVVFIAAYVVASWRGGDDGASAVLTLALLVLAVLGVRWLWRRWRSWRRGRSERALLATTAPPKGPSSASELVPEAQAVAVALAAPMRFGVLDWWEGRDPKRGGLRAWEMRLTDIQEHVLVGGAPGSGKTNFLVGLSRALRERRIGVVFCDLKGDPTLAERIGADAAFDLGGRGAWNPLAYVDPASARDVMIGAYDWSEPYYRDVASRYLGALLGGLGILAPSPRLDEVIGYLEQPARAGALVGSLDAAGAEREAQSLAGAIAVVKDDRAARSGVVGLGSRLAAIASSPATGGRLGPVEGEPQVDLAAVLDYGESAYFGLPSAVYPLEGPTIAGALLGALGALAQRSATGATEPLRAALIVDEAAQLSGAQLRRVVQVGRGAGLGIVLATQDLADFETIAPGTLEAVMTGCSTWVVLRQTASADVIARAVGTFRTTAHTIQKDAPFFGALGYMPTGVVSEREVEEFWIHPNVIRSLPRGRAAVYHRSSAWQAPWRGTALLDAQG